MGIVSRRLSLLGALAAIVALAALTLVPASAPAAKQQSLAQQIKAATKQLPLQDRPYKIVPARTRSACARWPTRRSRRWTATSR